MIAPEYEGIKVYLKVLVTRSGNITSQQSMITIKDDNLFWPGVRVGGEVVSEEPGTDRHLGIFSQRGVHHLNPAIFSWQGSSGICGDHPHLLTEDTEIRKVGYRENINSRW